MATFARVTRFEAPLDRVDESLFFTREILIPSARTATGFRGGYWLVDRTTGRGMALTVWDSEAAMHASEDMAERMRDEAADFGRILSVERYEVVAHA